MKKIFLPILFSCAITLGSKAQLITMSNKCYKLMQQANQQNSAGQYQDALNTFQQIMKKCSAKDAKREGYGGQAKAYNGLHQYQDAITAANNGLKVDNKNINCLFERATAYMNMGQLPDAQADLNTIVDLTKKNQNVKERATIISQIAILQYQQNQPQDALNTLTQAIATDGSNPDLYLFRGDMRTNTGDYNGAMEDYDHAIQLGSNPSSTYTTKINTCVKMYQAKYNTTSADELKKRMTSGEKSMFCNNLKQAQNAGMKNMQLDMLGLTLCP